MEKLLKSERTRGDKLSKKISRMEKDDNGFSQQLEEVVTKMFAIFQIDFFRKIFMISVITHNYCKLWVCVEWSILQIEMRISGCRSWNVCFDDIHENIKNEHDDCKNKATLEGVDERSSWFVRTTHVISATHCNTIQK